MSNALPQPHEFWKRICFPALQAATWELVFGNVPAGLRPYLPKCLYTYACTYFIPFSFSFHLLFLSHLWTGAEIEWTADEEGVYSGPPLEKSVFERFANDIEAYATQQLGYSAFQCLRSRQQGAPALCYFAAFGCYLAFFSKGFKISDTNIVRLLQNPFPYLISMPMGKGTGLPTMRSIASASMEKAQAGKGNQGGEGEGGVEEKEKGKGKGKRKGEKKEKEEWEEKGKGKGKG
jgi:hypothetical protein